MTLSVGVDACPGGWIAIATSDLRYKQALVTRSFAEMLNAFSSAPVIAIDIPIGLPEVGRRPSDEEARQFVGPRRSSVFFTPSRLLLENPWAAGRGISRQAHGLAPRIIEVERDLNERIYEVHPEVSFAAMKGGHLDHSKLSWAGLVERRELLAAQGILLPDDLGSAGATPPDDVYDAAAAAWTGHRIATGRARTLPAKPPLGAGSRPTAIWY
jgi:predicted RNase H-like nuclease